MCENKKIRIQFEIEPNNNNDYSIFEKYNTKDNSLASDLQQKSRELLEDKLDNSFLENFYINYNPNSFSSIKSRKGFLFNFSIPLEEDEDKNSRIINGIKKVIAENIWDLNNEKFCLISFENIPYYKMYYDHYLKIKR